MNSIALMRRKDPANVLAALARIRAIVMVDDVTAVDIATLLELEDTYKTFHTLGSTGIVKKESARAVMGAAMDVAMTAVEQIALNTGNRPRMPSGFNLRL